MQQQVDWRHWTGGAVAVLAICALGWVLLTRPAPGPNAPAPAGANPRMQDAPESVPGTQPRPGLPTAR